MGRIDFLHRAKGFLIASVAITAIGVLTMSQVSQLVASDRQIETASIALRKGPSGLALPRFVSLKSSRVNVRQGPSLAHRVKWMYVRAGFPVEVIQEHDNWRRIRDIRGNQGWVHGNLLSGRRTVQVGDWQKGSYMDLRTAADRQAMVRARLEPGVLASLRRCRNNWCQIDVADQSGWIEQDLLWGVYPRERY